MAADARFETAVRVGRADGDVEESVAVDVARRDQRRQHAHDARGVQLDGRRRAARGDVEVEEAAEPRDLARARAVERRQAGRRRERGVDGDVP